MGQFTIDFDAKSFDEILSPVSFAFYNYIMPLAFHDHILAMKIPTFPNTVIINRSICLYVIRIYKMVHMLLCSDRIYDHQFTIESLIRKVSRVLNSVRP